MEVSGKIQPHGNSNCHRTRQNVCLLQRHDLANPNNAENAECSDTRDRSQDLQHTESDKTQTEHQRRGQEFGEFKIGYPRGIVTPAARPPLVLLKSTMTVPPARPSASTIAPTQPHTPALPTVSPDSAPRLPAPRGTPTVRRATPHAQHSERPTVSLATAETPTIADILRSRAFTQPTTTARLAKKRGWSNPGLSRYFPAMVLPNGLWPTTGPISPPPPENRTQPTGCVRADALHGRRRKW